MTPIGKALGVAILISAGAGAEASRAPQFTADGELLRPENYREWIFLSSGLGMNYNQVNTQLGAPSFDNVFVNPESYREFVATGKWPDHTMFVLEIRSSTSHGSINRHGSYQEEVVAFEAAVKDEARFQGKWAYFNFAGLPGPLAKSAKPLPQSAGCFACHSANGAVENTFVQFYPTLLAVAERKGTLKAGFRVPVTRARLYQTLAEQGWESGHQLLAAEKAANPETQLSGDASTSRVAEALLRNGKKSEAIALLKFAAETNPRSAMAWQNLGMAYEVAGDKSASFAALEQALALVEGDDSLNPERRTQLADAIRARIAKVK